MNDRFKFRVWDKLDEEYYDENCFQMQIESSGDLFIIGVGNDGEDCFWETDNTVVEQCTGIKDRNGKLIYEGDIVELDDGTEINNAVIEWEEQSGQWVICTTDTTYTGTIYTFDNLYGNDLTVIGNIHENIDLLRNNDE